VESVVERVGPAGEAGVFDGPGDGLLVGIAGDEPEVVQQGALDHVDALRDQDDPAAQFGGREARQVVAVVADGALSGV